MRCSVPQLEGAMSWPCWPQDLHIYMEVSLYREAGGGGLRACRQRLRGLPEHTGQQLPAKVTHLLSGSWGCWYSCSLCAVQDGAGTATPALALAAESSKDHKYLISQERPWCWGSAVALQKEGRLWKSGLTWDRAQMCFEVVRQAET